MLTELETLKNTLLRQGQELRQKVLECLQNELAPAADLAADLAAAETAGGAELEQLLVSLKKHLEQQLELNRQEQINLQDDCTAYQTASQQLSKARGEESAGLKTQQEQWQQRQYTYQRAWAENQAQLNNLAQLEFAGGSNGSRPTTAIRATGAGYFAGYRVGGTRFC